MFLMITFIWGTLSIFDFSNIAQTFDGNRTIEFYSFFQIVWNNIKNFLGYVFLAPIFPMLFLMDFISTGISIVVSISVQGLVKTLLLLAPHGIIEIPNFLLYTYLSATLFWNFWKEKTLDISKYLSKIIGNRKYYIFCMIVIIIAGAIEGFITPALYQMLNL
jgi:uncharacterized membrane protein SpoIIM required for sporulation